MKKKLVSIFIVFFATISMMEGLVIALHLNPVFISFSNSCWALPLIIFAGAVVLREVNRANESIGKQ